MDKLFLAKESKETLKSIIKIRETTIDNSVFRLHYRATSLILIVFSILVTATQIFGEPIKCIQKDDIPEQVINTYCWIEGTYTLPKAFNKTIGIAVPYPGIDKTEIGDEVKEHAYYQWVCFVLFLQAIVFYLSRMMWKSWENHRIKHIISDLHRPIVRENRNIKCQLLAAYLFEKTGRNWMYALAFLGCEIFNFVNVVAQMFIIDRFLGGEFTTFGSEVVAFTRLDQDQRLDPMIRIFPRMTKCRFHRFGSSGDVQRHDAFCLLPLNIVNEKIYIIIWFWFVILAILSGLALVYRIALIFFPRLRKCVFTIYRVNKIKDINTVLDNCTYADWFFLRLISKNIESLHFAKAIEIAALIFRHKAACRPLNVSLFEFWIVKKTEEQAIHIDASITAQNEDPPTYQVNASITTGNKGSSETKVYKTMHATINAPKMLFPAFPREKKQSVNDDGSIDDKKEDDPLLPMDTPDTPDTPDNPTDTSTMKASDNKYKDTQI